MNDHNGFVADGWGWARDVYEPIVRSEVAAVLPPGFATLPMQTAGEFSAANIDSV